MKSTLTAAINMPNITVDKFIGFTDVINTVISSSSSSSSSSASFQAAVCQLYENYVDGINISQQQQH